MLSARLRPRRLAESSLPAGRTAQRSPPLPPRTSWGPTRLNVGLGEQQLICGLGAERPQQTWAPALGVWTQTGPATGRGGRRLPPGQRQPEVAMDGDGDGGPQSARTSQGLRAWRWGRVTARRRGPRLEEVTGPPGWHAGPGERT